MNWYPFPERTKISIWDILMSYTEVKAVWWCLKALAVGCVVALIIWWW